MRTLNDLMTELVDELAASEVPDALAQPITLAALWAGTVKLSSGPRNPPHVGRVLACHQGSDRQSVPLREVYSPLSRLVWPGTSLT